MHGVFKQSVRLRKSEKCEKQFFGSLEKLRN